MAEQPDNPTEEIPTPARGGLSSKIKALAVVGLIVLAQCGAAIFLLPSAEQTAAMAQSQRVVEQATATEETVEQEIVVEDGKPMQEIDLGDFSVSAYQPLSNTTLRIDFHLYGTVAEEDLTDVKAELDEQTNRIREDVIVTVRSSNIEDLTDAGLGLIKRRILDKTNRRLGKPYLKSVIFSDFSFLEQ